mgnify:CR=1 FL=1
MGFWGPFTAGSLILDPSMTDNNDQFFVDQRAKENPMPIDPLNRNKFVDPNEYGLQTVKNDQTFQPESGATLQEMLAERDLQLAAQPTLSQAKSPLSFKYDQPEGVVRDYLGAGSPMLNEKGNAELSSLTAYEYDPAFGQLENYYRGSTAYPGSGSRTGYFDDYADYAEVPSLQRRLGNERFSLGEPQNLGFEESETISAPIYQDRIRQQNLPGFAYEPPKGLASIINSQLQNAKTNVGQKVGQGWDFAQQLPGMAMSALSGIPGIGALMGMLPKTSPEQKAMMDLYNSGEYQDVLGQIPGAENLNPVYGMGAGYGLSGALGKRLAMRNSQKTQNRIAKLSQKRQDKFAAQSAAIEQAIALEKAKIGARIGASGKIPTSGGGGTPDQGGTYGGYSYGGEGQQAGRQGYGYGLRDGGLATLFTRRG